MKALAVIAGHIIGGLLMVVWLMGCGKGYIIHTDIDAKGNKQKVVVTQEVQREWAWFVGSDLTIESPMRCPIEAIGWKGELDKEQCTIDHDHLTGPNKGQTRLVRTVHANDTIGKKVLPTLWMAALWGWLLSGGGQGDQNVTQTNSNQAILCDNCPLPGGGSGGHGVIKP